MSRVCERCDGTGFEIVEQDGHQYAVRCDCQRASKKAAGEGGFLAACRIPARYAHCNLDDFQLMQEPLLAAVSKCRRYCDGYPYSGATDEGLGLLLVGRNGVGKTHLAVGVLRELVTKKGASGQFWDYHALTREIRRSYDPETRTTEHEVLRPVVETEILLLDDLGAWKMTDWMLDTLFYILNSRYMAKRATFITTNYEDVPPDIAASDISNRRKEYLVERVGQRVRSRLMEMCLVVKIEGVSDYRLTLQASNDRSMAHAMCSPPGGKR